MATKFVVQVEVTTTYSVEVVAESEDEAIAKAESMEYSEMMEISETVGFQAEAVKFH